MMRAYLKAVAITAGLLGAWLALLRSSPDRIRASGR
jgi:hypothetical protein